MIRYDKNVIISKDENISLESWNETRNASKHTHDFFELVYTMGGSAVHYIDDVKYKVGHGDLIFINKSQTHSYTVNGNVQMVNILLNPEFISDELADEENILLLFKYSLVYEIKNTDTVYSQRISFEGKDLIEVDNLITMLVREYNDKRICYKTVLNNGIKLLFAKILRYIHANIPEALKDKESINTILSYINDNLDKKFSIAKLAARSFYTPAYFGHIIKKHCNKSFNEYLKEKRMEKAVEYLITTDESIEDIAFNVGYSGRPLFHRHFKEIYGVTPGQYRRKCKTEEI